MLGNIVLVSCAWLGTCRRVDVNLSLVCHGESVHVEVRFFDRVSCPSDVHGAERMAKSARLCEHEIMWPLKWEFCG